ncbi:Transcriptional regulatory protein QseF [Planctomycetes bacterium MalM25]|nr:Transcriptional regulatory protein QseF [Planctomycetes bacterium MalM25]
MNAQVLIVDDDPMLLASLRRCLQDRYSIQVAESGVEALKHLANADETPVVISDLRMPVMNGVEFLIQASEITRNSQFLMLTGTPKDSERIRSSHGDLVSRFLTKPCNPDDLAAAIDEALENYARATSAGAPVAVRA